MPPCALSVRTTRSGLVAFVRRARLFVSASNNVRPLVMVDECAIHSRSGFDRILRGSACLLHYLLISSACADSCISRDQTCHMAACSKREAPERGSNREPVFVATNLSRSVQSSTGAVSGRHTPVFECPLPLTEFPPDNRLENWQSDEIDTYMTPSPIRAVSTTVPRIIWPDPKTNAPRLAHPAYACCAIAPPFFLRRLLTIGEQNAKA
jgi:hypothetical protein